MQRLDIVLEAQTHTHTHTPAELKGASCSDPQPYHSDFYHINPFTLHAISQTEEKSPPSPIYGSWKTTCMGLTVDCVFQASYH